MSPAFLQAEVLYVGRTVEVADVFRALSFAARAHRNQVRKGTGEPYINHLIDVVELLVRVAHVNDAAVLVAAALHDVIEDTSTAAGDGR